MGSHIYKYIFCILAVMGMPLSIKMLVDHDKTCTTVSSVLLVIGCAINFICACVLIGFLFRFFREHVEPSGLYSSLGYPVFRSYDALIGEERRPVNPSSTSHTYETIGSTRVSGRSGTGSVILSPNSSTSGTVYENEDPNRNYEKPNTVVKFKDVMQSSESNI